jgi:putative Holliday junction resolvase
VTRILGLDVGERRIGLAISTPEGRLAVPLRVLERRGDAADMEAIAALARAEQVETLVIGHPLSMDGSAGPQARRVEAFARRLAKATGLPFELWDERLSSVQAERSVRPLRGRRRAPSDDLAAAIILQGYLDRQRA